LARLLVTGASGLLGANLVLEARGRHAVTAVCHAHPIALDGVEVVTADLAWPAAADELLQATRPEWIVHCAAAADVDRCEQEPEWAARLNRQAAAAVARAAARIGGRLIHISTDAVFDGERGGYQEIDEPHPISVYGRTKLEGERAVLDAHPSAAVLRVNFYGWHPAGRRGLAEWFLDRLESGQATPGFVDAWISPLLVNDLAERILQIAARPLAGVYHVAGGACVSKYEFGRRLARAFDLDEELVQPAQVAAAGLIGPRPRNLCLDGSRLAAEAGLPGPGLEESLDRFRRLRESGYVASLKALAGTEPARERRP
jgi:dTDP-4-dehydrorhamnose reductase